MKLADGVARRGTSADDDDITYDVVATREKRLVARTSAFEVRGSYFSAAFSRSQASSTWIFFFSLYFRANSRAVNPSLPRTFGSAPFSSRTRTTPASGALIMGVNPSLLFALTLAPALISSSAASASQPHSMSAVMPLSSAAFGSAPAL